MKRPRLRGFLYSYLLCAMLWTGLVLIEAIDEQRRLLDADESVAPVPRLVQSIIAALALALCSIPIRILLGLFPEPSGEGLVRLLRRVLIGALCGPLPVMIVLLLSRGGSRGGEAMGIGLLFGAVVGLGDSLARDAARTASPDGDPE